MRIIIDRLVCIMREQDYSTGMKKEFVQHIHFFACDSNSAANEEYVNILQLAQRGWLL